MWPIINIKISYMITDPRVFLETVYKCFFDFTFSKSAGYLIADTTGTCALDEHYFDSLV